MATRKRQYNGQKEKTIQWPQGKDNTMATRKGTNNDLHNTT